MKIITKRPDGSRRVQTKPEGETKTQQQFKDQVNINKIMAKYKKTGQISHINPKPGIYADLTQIGSYEELMNKVVKANEAFSQLPSEVRTRFGHQPDQLVKFLDDPKNQEEGIKLGLLSRRKVESNPVLDELKDLNKNLKSKSEPEPKK